MSVNTPEVNPFPAPSGALAPWRNVRVEDASYPAWDGYSSLSRHIFQCGFNVAAGYSGAHAGYYGRTPPVGRCGGEGLYTVTRTSNLTDNTYTDYACEGHAAGWRTEKEG